MKIKITLVNEKRCHHYLNHIFFQGRTNTQFKNESKFEEWKGEIECLKKSGVYSEYIVNQSLWNYVKGQARRVLFTLGSATTTEQIMNKFERTLIWECCKWPNCSLIVLYS